MTQLTATFTVTIKTKPDGDYYFDHDDLVRNVVPWIEGGLDDRDDIAEVTITEQPAAVSAAVAPPTNHTALRETVARALYGAHSHIDVWDQADQHAKAVVYAEVDAVLAVLPAPADRAAEDADGAPR